nr:AAA family ATPase [Acetobacter malorum]
MHYQKIGKRVLVMDLDPQCNLTIYSMSEDQIGNVWSKEDHFIEDFQSEKSKMKEEEFKEFCSLNRSVHFCLKPIEDGTGELEILPDPVRMNENFSLLPGRLTLHMFEAKVSERFNSVYSGDPLAIRTATSIRSLAKRYAEKFNYDYVIVDTSPSLGSLNRNILSQADAFLIPANPDLFSDYGIRNIGSALSQWKKQFESIFSLLSDAKRHNFPKRFVQFIGYTLYNAKKVQGSKSTNELGIARAHYNYAKKIPETIFKYIPKEDMVSIDNQNLKTSIGNQSVIYGHSTLPSMAQKYHKPMWDLPSFEGLETADVGTIKGNRKIYEDTKNKYVEFAKDVIDRMEKL